MCGKKFLSSYLGMCKRRKLHYQYQPKNIENIVPQVLTKICDMSYRNSKTLMENILSASKCK